MSLVPNIAAIGLVVLTATAANAAPAGSAAQLRAGRELAQTVCSACHQVEAKQETLIVLDPPAPSFQTIADKPGTTQAGLRKFMAHTKWDAHTLPMTMPDLMLTPEQQDVLSRYILSQKTIAPR